jgi:transaldolase
MNIKSYCKSNGLNQVYVELLARARQIRDDEEIKMAADLMKIPGMTVNPSFFGMEALTSKHLVKAIEEKLGKKVAEFEGSKWYDLFTTYYEGQLQNAIKSISLIKK